MLGKQSVVQAHGACFSGLVGDAGNKIALPIYQLQLSDVVNAGKLLQVVGKCHKNLSLNQMKIASMLCA